MLPKSYWCSGIVVNPDAALNIIEGRPRIDGSAALIHKPINIIKPVYVLAQKNCYLRTYNSKNRKHYG